MRIASSLLLAIGMIVTAQAQLPVEANMNQHALLQSSDPQLAANKRLTFDFWRHVLVAHDMDKAVEYMDEDYIQHNPAIPTGRAAFIGFFGRMPQMEAQETIDGLVTIMAEGDLVTMALRRECADPRNPGETYTTTWFDMFRIEDGKIAEHWDYGTVTDDDNPSDCTRAGG
jgi:predicted SnoaL-like aldol condensation-catalyzing enzyme